MPGSVAESVVHGCSDPNSCSALMEHLVNGVVAQHDQGLAVAARHSSLSRKPAAPDEPTGKTSGIERTAVTEPLRKDPAMEVPAEEAPETASVQSRLAKVEPASVTDVSPDAVGGGKSSPATPGRVPPGHAPDVAAGASSASPALGAARQKSKSLSPNKPPGRHQRSSRKSPATSTPAELADKRARINAAARRRRREKKRKAAAAWESDEDTKTLVTRLKRTRGRAPREKKAAPKQEDLMLRGPVIRVARRRPEPGAAASLSPPPATKDEVVNRAGPIPRHRPRRQQDLALATDRFKQTTQGVASGAGGRAKLLDTWVCVLCGKPPHHLGLGDLFGPYSLDASSSPIFIPRHVNELWSPTREKRSQHSNTLKALTSAGSPSKPRRSPKKWQPDEFVLTASDSEFWVHGGCVTWAPDVAWVPGRGPVGLPEAVMDASQKLCSYCRERGATLGCHKPGCSKQYHYACAKSLGCALDEENFVMCCPTHSKRTSVHSRTEEII